LDFGLTSPNFHHGAPPVDFIRAFGREIIAGQ